MKKSAARLSFALAAAWLAGQLYPASSLLGVAAAQENLASTMLTASDLGGQFQLNRGEGFSWVQPEAWVVDRSDCPSTRIATTSHAAVYDRPLQSVSDLQSGGPFRVVAYLLLSDEPFVDLWAECPAGDTASEAPVAPDHLPGLALEAQWRIVRRVLSPLELGPFEGAGPGQGFEWLRFTAVIEQVPIDGFAAGFPSPRGAGVVLAWGARGQVTPEDVLRLAQLVRGRVEGQDSGAAADFPTTPVLSPLLPNRYTNAMFRWSISYPEGWTVDASDTAFVRIAPSSSALVGVHSTCFTDSRTLDGATDQLLGRMEQSLRQSGKTFRVLTRDGISLSGNTAARDVLIELGPGGKSRIVSTIVGNCFFAANFETQDILWARFEDVFNEMIRSLSFQ